MTLIDSYNRTIDYLRVSVTDRCNFRCVYCMPEEGAPIAPKADILTYEEIERLVRIAVDLGMTKFRLTGGEPLIRRDIAFLVQRLGAIPGIKDLSITTNGFLLAQHAQEFARSGLNRVNISLDTLRPDRFERIARRGNLEAVLVGIAAASEANLAPIKLNCVVMRGYNDDEIVDFARLSLENRFDVRFIELMPINWSRGDDSSSESSQALAGLFALSAPSGYRTDTNIQLYAREELNTFKSEFQTPYSAPQLGQLDAVQLRKSFVPTSEMVAMIESTFGSLVPAEVVTNGPAHSFRVPGALGTIGFISQITNDMCINCNRLRLTADGQLRPCLMADGEVDLRAALRGGADDAEIARLFELTVLHKPKEHRLEDGKMPVGRNMSQLGG